MQTDGRRAWDIKIACLGGGSCGRLWALMRDLALEGALAGTLALYDVDAEAAQKNAAIGNRMKNRAEVVGKFNYVACKSQAEALEGADFVVLSLLPGTLREVESDLCAPQLCGVYQPVGDTTGPGGLMRALRAGPIYQRIALDVKAYCPDAFVLNYTTPMAHCLRVLYDAFPAIRAFGWCGETASAKTLLCKALYDICGIAGVRRRSLVTQVQGINHFTWIAQASWRGMDLLPVYRAFAEKYAETGYVEGADGDWQTRPFECAHRVKFDLFLRYGAIAAASDRCLAEFLPCPRYLRTPECAAEWKFALTPISWHHEERARRAALRERYVSGAAEMPLTPSGDMAVAIFKALLGLGDLTVDVNLPNAGQITNVPLGAVVETGACVRDHHIAPLVTGPLPPQILSLTMPALAAQEAVLDAVRGRDAQKAVSAFVDDPLMCRVSGKNAVKLMRAMLSGSSAYLRGFHLDVR